MVSFSQEYIDQLRDYYPDHGALVDEATNPANLRMAALPHQPGEHQEYLRLQEGSGEHQVMYVPGLTEGLVSKLPIGLEMASRGFDFTIADQNRADISEDVTTAQARNQLAVMEAEGLQHGGIDFIGKSYGGIVLSRMAEMEPAAFQDSRIILLASAGLKHEWLNLPGMARRLWKYQATEGGSKHDIYDVDGTMYQAGMGLLTENKWRSLHEMVHLATRQVNHELMLEVSSGRLAVGSFADDEMYPQRVQERRMRRVVAAGGRWFVPLSIVEGPDGLRIDEGATHNDEQFNPYRVGGALEQLLRRDQSFARPRVASV